MDKMKIIAITCDDYLHILKGFVYMFNKYWVPRADVTVLGYRSPSFDLPDNFKFVSLGDQEKYGRDWTSALIPFFKQLRDEYFLLLLEDIYILNVDKSLLHEAEKHMANGIEKVRLTFDTRLGDKKDANFKIMEQDATYRLSLQPSFIRRDYFLKYLEPGKTIWEYETNHDAVRNNGAQILIPEKAIVYYSNFVHKGEVKDIEQISRIKKEDLGVIKQLGLYKG